MLQEVDMAIKNDKQIKSLIKQRKVGYHSLGQGLYIRISKEYSGFWVVRYSIHGKRREISIGKYGELSLAGANLQAAQIKVDVKAGIDPLAERQRVSNKPFKVVDDLAEDWLKDCKKRLKHPRIPKQVYRDYISPYIGRLALEQVTARDIRGIITQICDKGIPTRSNDALMYCKQLFRHGIKLDLLSINPAAAFTTDDAGGVEKSRNRALSIEELEKVFACFRQYSDQFTRENYLAMALLVSLGVRKGELIAAKWEEFYFEPKDADLARWDIPKERSKTGVPITIPLPELTVEWLRELKIRACGSEFVFPNRRASIRFGHISPDTLNVALQKLFKQEKMPVEHFTIHDMRRTFRSLLSSEGVRGHIAERCLNHKLKGVEGIYDRYDYLDERREALGKISMVLDSKINV